MPFDFDAAVAAPVPHAARAAPAGAGRAAADAACAPGVAAPAREAGGAVGASARRRCWQRPVSTPRPALRALARACRRRAPAGARAGTADAPMRTRLGWAVDGDGRRSAAGSFGLAPRSARCLRALPRRWRLAGAAEPGLRRGLRHRRRRHRHACPGSPSACPRTGRPRTRSAATSPRSMRRWPTTRCCSPPATQLMRLVTGAERWERFVWTVTAHPRLHAPPGARATRHAGRPASTPTRSRRSLVAHRAPDLHPAARAARRRCSRSRSTCSRWPQAIDSAAQRRAAARRARHR